MRQLTEKEYKEVLLDILGKIDTICRDNNIKYSLAYGTLLGAIRHKGFIPWDDDADIMMPRDDYQRLIDFINTSDCGLKFLTMDNSDDYYFPFGKICDMRTVLFEGEFNQICNYGAYVDVFPMARIPFEAKWRNYRKWKRRFLLVTYSNMRMYHIENHSIKSILKYMGYRLSKVINTKKVLQKLALDEKNIDSNVEDSGTNFEYGLLWDFARFPCDSFENQSILEFENHMFLGPNNPDQVLRSSYGDYHKLPSVAERKHNHNLRCYWK